MVEKWDLAFFLYWFGVRALVLAFFVSEPRRRANSVSGVELEFVPNSLYYGDCLDVLREWPAAVVDLVYLDPPFNSQTNYNVLYGSRNGASAQLRAFGVGAPREVAVHRAEVRERIRAGVPPVTRSSSV